MSRNLFSKITGISLIFTLLSAPLLVQAEIYKWKDKNGEVHYSQFPPENQKASRLKVETGTIDDSGQKALNKSLGKIDKENKAKAKEEEKKKKEEQQKDLKEKSKEVAEKIKTGKKLTT